LVLPPDRDGTDVTIEAASVSLRHEMDEALAVTMGSGAATLADEMPSISLADMGATDSLSGEVWFTVAVP
jgi:hypothetical protein